MYEMIAQPTAVVLDQNQLRRDQIRTSLFRCGVMPICFCDEWICLENMQHIRPGFAVIRTDSATRVSRFVNLSKAINKDFPIIVLSGQSRVEEYIRGNWLGNLFYLNYPADDQELRHTISLLAAGKPTSEHPVLIAGSRQRKKLMEDLPLFGMAKEPILIQGENGVGKKRIAKAIYYFSTAKSTQVDFLKAGNITRQWLYETRNRPDVLYNKMSSTTGCVLENIEELPYALQSQFMNLMDKTNNNGAGDRSFTAGIPIITLAGCDLKDKVRQGLFRNGLYHRLSVLKISVPPLRGHTEDIRALAEFFAACYGVQCNGSVGRLTQEVMGKLEEYHWPGNVPELKKLIKQFMLTDKDHWMEKLPTSKDPAKQQSHRQTLIDYVNADEIKEYLKGRQEISLKKASARYGMRVEKKLMKAALAQTRGNCKKAAGLLNISYKSMLNKAKAYHLM
jgi:DNA-binding NtrC family response regulator